MDSSFTQSTIMKVLGYQICAYDNDSFMNPDQYEINICHCLDYVINRQAHINPEFVLSKKNYDVSYTYDSYLIVSERFKDFCEDNAYKGISFYTIPNYKTKFVMIVDNTVKIDAKRRGVKFLEYNPKCNEYNEVISASCICLANNDSLTEGFFKTDIAFGRGYAKHNSILIDINTWLKIKEQKFKGLHLEEILDIYKREKKR